KHAKNHNVEEEAKAYLEYLYSPVAQRLAAKHFYRPVHPEFADQKDLQRFPDVTLFTVDDVFGGWQQAQKKHFNDGGVFDKIYQPGR
ncbi:sulfate ABC transporter substrate-binding protein, partial [Streptomyces brasiliscabiei]